MKKRHIILFYIIIGLSLFILTSCSKNSDNATIQLWYYEFNDESNYKYDIRNFDAIIRTAKKFCQDNDIPLEIIKYDESTISHEDYILKRNIAATSGNMIIIEDVKYLHSIAKQHADYTKLEYYDYLISGYKDRFCIPLGSVPTAFSIENKKLEQYGIDTSNKPLLLYSEYLEIKQDMKKKGDRYKLNYSEFGQLIDYYLYKNGLLFINSKNEVVNDNGKLKEALKKSIFDLCNDIVLYFDGLINDNLNDNRSYQGEGLVDENSELSYKKTLWHLRSIINPYRYNIIENINTSTYIMHPYAFVDSTPCFYMYKKITNDKIWDLANHLVSEATYLYILNSRGINYPYYGPVFNLEATRKRLRVNDNWEYLGNERFGTNDEKILKLINDTYNIFVKDEEKSNEVADYYFYNVDYDDVIKKLVKKSIFDIADKLLSEEEKKDKIDNNVLESSLEKFDSNDEVINRFIEEKIDDFIKNFTVHYK